jgi:hypothetical protein
MPYYGMKRRMVLVRTDISEECNSSIIRVTKIGDLRTTLAVTSIVFFRRLRRLLVIANIFLSSSILAILKMEVL